MQQHHKQKGGQQRSRGQTYYRTEIATEMVNEKGGVPGKYKVEAKTADAQSKADIAINEAEPLLNTEKVEAFAGIYSSAHAVTLGAKVDQQPKLW